MFLLMPTAARREAEERGLGDERTGRKKTAEAVSLAASSLETYTRSIDGATMVEIALWAESCRCAATIGRQNSSTSTGDLLCPREMFSIQKAVGRWLGIPPCSTSLLLPHHPVIPLRTLTS